ncbi:hypothetical protein D3C76_1646720 [compost metagenome]
MQCPSGFDSLHSPTDYGYMAAILQVFFQSVRVVHIPEGMNIVQGEALKGECTILRSHTQ